MLWLRITVPNIRVKDLEIYLLRNIIALECFIFEVTLLYAIIELRGILSTFMS